MKKNKRYEAVVIGASAGAMHALSSILPNLKPDYPFPIMIVVHLPSDKKSVLAALFQEKCQMEVREAEDKEPIEKGKIYFSPPNYHLLVETDKSLSLSVEDPILFSRPSIDVLFETAAEVYQEKLIGIILTGANEDGAAGLKAIQTVGGTVIVQNPSLAYASAMPRAALDSCSAAQSMDLDQIVGFLQKAAS